MFAVPGSPATSLAEMIRQAKPGSAHQTFEWSVNEKVAVETAYGVAEAGFRSAVILKQCGLHTALDSLMNAVFHTVNEGMVVFVGDDEDASSSTLLLDSRLLAKTINIPCLELDLYADPTQLVSVAYEISTACKIPVLIRFVGSISPNAIVDLTERNLRRLQGLGKLPTLDPQVLTKFGRRQAHRLLTWPEVTRLVNMGGLVSATHQSSCHLGIIRFAGCAELNVAFGDACSLVSRCAWPIPNAVVEFAAQHTSILVLESPLPFAEDQLEIVCRGNSTAMIGRRSGHLAPEGPISASHATAALEAARGATCGDVVPCGRQWDSIEVKDSEPVRHKLHSLFRVLTQLREEGIYISVDVGSSVALCYPPYQAATSALCLGAPVAVAAGFARASGRSAISVIGDYGLLHSGIQAVMESVARDIRLTVIVLCNGTMEQTGGQPVLTHYEYRRPLDLRGMLLALGVDLVLTCGAHTSEEQFYSSVCRALEAKGVSVVLIQDVHAGVNVS